MECPCCGAAAMRLGKALWHELIQAWELAPHEVAYIDRQQALCCGRCGCNLRSMALAAAIVSAYAYRGLFKDFVTSEAARSLHVLELNDAGHLGRFLCALPGRVLARYPQVDMERLPYADAAFDLVVHSDTLEHVPHPVRGLAECRRVLKPGGFCAFTVPIVVDRMTRSREGLPPSYHGSPRAVQGDYRVQTEYGADAWKHAMLAGFRECRILALEYPAGLALVAVK